MSSLIGGAKSRLKTRTRLSSLIMGTRETSCAIVHVLLCLRMSVAQIGHDEIEDIEQNTDQEKRAVAGEGPGAARIQCLPELLFHIGRVKLDIRVEFAYAG